MRHHQQQLHMSRDFSHSFCFPQTPLLRQAISQQMPNNPRGGNQSSQRSRVMYTPKVLLEQRAQLLQQQSTNGNSTSYDQYSENSTCSGSEENNPDELLESLAILSTASMPTVQRNVAATSVLNTQNNFHSHTLNSSSSGSSNIPEEAKYKTEMCKNWVEIGRCNYGEKCKFAHGKQELQQKAAINKHFKTKPCKHFFESGTCSYGQRCHFLHDTRSFNEITSNISFQQRLEKMVDTVTNPFPEKRLSFFESLTAKNAGFESEKLTNNINSRSF